MPTSKEERFSSAINHYNEHCGWLLEVFEDHSPLIAREADANPTSEAGELRLMGTNALSNAYFFFRANGHSDDDAHELTEQLAPKIIGAVENDE